MVGENEVKKFAEAMIETLNEPKNLAKGGWEGCSFNYLFGRLKDETDELYWAVNAIEQAKKSEFSQELLKSIAKQLLKEATDIANFAMMIANNAGTLK
jgi:hypothetical protein